MGISKKKVVKIALAVDKHNEPETFIAKKSGAVIYSSLITFEDGKVGTFQHEGKVQDYFKIGEEVEFETKNMGTWFQLFRAGGNKKWNKPSGWVPKSPSEIKREGLTFILGDVTKLVIADKVKVDEMVGKYDELVDAFFKNVDKVKDE
jgi:hypothetical protein